MVAALRGPAASARRPALSILLYLTRPIPRLRKPHPQLERRRPASRMRALQPETAMKLKQAGVGAEGAQQRRARQHDELVLRDAPGGHVDFELADRDVGAEDDLWMLRSLLCVFRPWARA